MESAKPSGPKLIQEWKRHWNWACWNSTSFLADKHSSRDCGLQGCKEQSGIKLSFHALAAELNSRYLTRWNTHPAPSLLPFSQVNCVRLNPTMDLPANQAPGPGSWPDLLAFANPHVVPEAFLRRMQFPPLGRPLGHCSWCSRIRSGFKKMPTWVLWSITNFYHIFLCLKWRRDAEPLAMGWELTLCRLPADFPREFR